MSRAAAAFATFPLCPQMLFRHEVLAAPGKLFQTSSPGLSFLLCGQPDILETAWVPGTDRCGLESRPHTD